MQADAPCRPHRQAGAGAGHQSLEQDEGREFSGGAAALRPTRHEAVGAASWAGHLFGRRDLEKDATVGSGVSELPRGIGGEQHGVNQVGEVGWQEGASGPHANPEGTPRPARGLGEGTDCRVTVPSEVEDAEGAGPYRRCGHARVG